MDVLPPTTYHIPPTTYQPMIKEQEICDGRIWIDVFNPTAQEMEDLASQYSLNRHTVKDCMEPEHLPKYELDNDANFLILRLYSHEANKDTASIQGLTDKIAIFFTDKFLITIHKASAPFLDIIRRKYVNTDRCDSVADVLIRIAWHALETYDDPANRLFEQVDFFEAQVMSRKGDGGKDLIESLYIIKRHASVAYKILMLMQEPINHLATNASGDQAALQDLKDQHLKMRTLYSQILEEVNNLTNLTMSFSAQRTNHVVRILTVFSVFFMPLTFIVGIYGMNFDYMPELRSRWGYPIVLGAMVIVSAVIYFWFKRKKWL